MSRKLPAEFHVPMQQAITRVLSEKMLAYGRERAMRFENIPLTGAAKVLWREGQASGRAESVLAILETRGARVTKAQRASILGCEVLEALKRHLVRAGTASSTKDVLA